MHRTAHDPHATLLPDGIDVASVSEQSRRAALAFLNEAPMWGKADLARWLIGPYAEATGVREPPRHSDIRALRGRHVEAPVVDDVLTDARVRVLSAVETAAISHAPVAFAFRYADRGMLLRVVDASGRRGWMARATPRMRLFDRVLSLLAADALTRPRDYVLGLRVCHRCERVRIDAAARFEPCPCRSYDTDRFGT